ncbi:sensor histidine kinase [Caulobacter sp. KR2-114]|uniref:sensor histidine kinase n=1 Tax=Caulobacter sp. KR2-114 TaxID=3400912 RepID=UPI003BFD5F50
MRRLVLLASVWSLAVVIVTGLALIVFFARASTARFDDSLSELVDNLVAGTSLDDAGQVAAPPLTDQRALRAYSGKYWEIAQATEVGGFKAVVRSRSLWDQELSPPPEGVAKVSRSPGKAVFYDSHGPQKGEHVRVAAMQALLPDMKSPLIFLAAEDRSPIDRDLRNFAASVALALALLGAGLVTAVVIQVRFGLEPLFALRREVAAVRTGKSERVAGAYPTELEPLANELNALVSHNQEVVERQRTHVGNLAHALKTPLSVMLAEAAAQPGSLAEVVTRQSETMRQQVDHHLRRARAAARAQGPGERTAVGPVLEELTLTLDRVFQGDDAEIDWLAPDDLFFLGERQDLLEIAGNVMENACKWRRRRVWAKAEPISASQFRLTVEDDGPGLPEGGEDQALKRGTRLDETAPGSGLGLSIVDELVRAYGGTMSLSRSSMGGLRVEMSLPRAET